VQLSIEIPDEKIAEKIIKILEAFKEDGVKVLKYNKNSENDAKSNWREIVMNTHSTNIDDDEYLYEAAWEFYNEKYSD